MWTGGSTTSICSTGPSTDGVIRRSSTLPPPLGTVRYSITFSIPPIGLDLEGFVNLWRRFEPRVPDEGGRRIPVSSEFGLQHSEAPQMGGPFSSSSNWTMADPLRLLGRPCCGCCCDLLWDICGKGNKHFLNSSTFPITWLFQMFTIKLRQILRKVTFALIS